MREYEVMHVHEPHNNSIISTRESLRLSGIIVNDSATVEDEDTDVAGELPENLSRPGATTVIIRQKQSYLHRLSTYLTITRFLSSYNNSSNSGVTDSERLLDQELPRRLQSRQDPDMKLKQRWILALFVLISTLIILLLSTVQFRSITKLTSHQLGITVDLEELTERGKCPACFGVNLCPQVITGKIELNDWNKFAMSRLVNVKNVFYATWDDGGLEKQVVLKKLAHNSELSQLDKSICDRRHGEGSDMRNCEVPEAVINLIEKYKIENQNPEGPIILNGETIGKGSDLLLCPSHRKMDFLVNAAAKFSRGQHHTTILANILTMILLNPEPLLLQAFPARDGWPFPIYHGACGRLIAEEYIGRRLTTYYQEPFLLRAHLSLQLLEMANKFYENPTNFILYLTDMTPDNFAVDDDTHKLKVIDLEDFIVVDKEVLIKSKVRDSAVLLEAESSACGTDGNRENMCFSFSTKDLCERPLTDHNYYAVCAGLLAPGALADEFPNGLLHSPPSELTDDPKFGRFVDILEKCKDPKHELPKNDFHMTRVEAAQELIVILNKYLKSQQSE